MPDFADVIFTGITINHTDEDNSEWRLNMGADTASQSMHYDWNVDGVSTGDYYGLSENNHPVEAVFMVAPGQPIFIHAGGYEEDDPGFPLFDPNDGLPGFGFNIDPAAASPGNDYQVSAAAGDFNYTLHMDINYFHFG